MDKKNINFPNNIKIERYKEHKRVTNINLNSLDRIVNPKNISENIIYCKNNPLNFIINDKNLVIKNSSKHKLKLNDRIILQNVESNIYYLKGGLTFTKNNYFVKINHLNHNIIDSDIQNDLCIYLFNVIGSSNNNTSIGNISLSSLNTKHKVYLKSDNDLIGSNNYYYIKLSKLPNVNYSDTISNIKIKYSHIAGIPINTINANYPISNDQTIGYLLVSNITDDYTFSVELKSYATKTISDIGGSNVYFSKIKAYIPAYVNPNNYVISLNKTFTNVTKIKLISSEFINSENLIKEFPENQRNNNLYFQILEDNDHTYKISINSGNYNINTLIKEITDKFNSIIRINYNNYQVKDENNKILLEQNKYLKSNITIDENTNIFTIKLFNSITIKGGIKVSKILNNEGKTNIIITHMDHNLHEGDKIIISNALSTSQIPESILNATHTIDSIIDQNNYNIILNNFNKSSVTDDNGGGDNIQILIPIKFRLLFNYKDTLGDILGFRNVGETNSITKYDYCISNNMPYENDYFKDSVGNTIYYDTITNKVQNNKIQLFGFNYLLMTCNVFNNEALSTNNINNLFAKIILDSKCGERVFSKFVQLADELNLPIKKLNELEFKFYSPEGNLYNFNGTEHSFTLEIHEIVYT